jgi:hypothetical protein
MGEHTPTQPAHFGKYSKTIRELYQTINYLAKFTEEEVGRKQVEIDALVKALEEILQEVGTSTKAHKIAREALASLAQPPRPGERS